MKLVSSKRTRSYSHKCISRSYMYRVCVCVCVTVLAEDLAVRSCHRSDTILRASNALRSQPWRMRSQQCATALAWKDLLSSEPRLAFFYGGLSAAGVLSAKRINSFTGEVNQRNESSETSRDFASNLASWNSTKQLTVILLLRLMHSRFYLRFSAIYILFVWKFFKLSWNMFTIVS